MIAARTFETTTSVSRIAHTEEVAAIREAIVVAYATEVMAGIGGDFGDAIAPRGKVAIFIFDGLSG